MSTTNKQANHANDLQLTKRRGLQARKRRETFTFFIFILPALFVFLNVVLIPFIIGVVYSFTNWAGFSFAGSEFVGVENYRNVLGEARFLSAFGRTFVYAFAVIILVNVIGLALALLVTSNIKTQNTLRSIYFLPNMIGGLILGFVWQFVFSRLFPQIGSVLGMENVFFNWLNDRQMAMVAIIIVSVWQQAGYVMVIYVAGITAISGDVMEAASIDGANSWQRLIRVTLPLMIPTITINLFVTMSGAMKQYDINLSLTGGGPGGSTELIAMNIYQTAYGYQNYAQAQAKAVLFFLVIMVITLAQLTLSRRKETRA